MPSLNGRIARLEHGAAVSKSAEIRPTDGELANLLDVYLAQLDEVLSGISPDVLEAVDEALRRNDAPPESSVREYINSGGIHYHHFLPGPGCKTVVYRWTLEFCKLPEGALLWVLAAILEHGVASMVVTKDAMQGDLVVAGGSGEWLSPYAGQHAGWNMQRLISRIERKTHDVET